MSEQHDSAQYKQRKAHFDRFLTLYGRNPVLEALRDNHVHCVRLHLSNSNRSDARIEEMIKLASARGAETVYHDRRELSRISRNGRQDQGVAVDINWDGYQDLGTFINAPQQHDVIALDRIHNPQNLGMLIRTVTAAGGHGLALPRKGGCDVDPMVMKASAGTLFRATLLRCNTLEDGLLACRKAGYEICVLDGSADESLFTFTSTRPVVMVLGNETDGISTAVRQLADRFLSIPLANSVESLNVSIAGALVAYRRLLKP